MHVGTHPKRWKKDPSLPDTMPNEKEDDWKEQARRNRFQKMKVTRLDYYDNRVKERKFEPTSLKERTQKLSKLKDLAPKLTNWINLAQELAQELTRLEDFAQKPGSQQLAKELTEWKELARELSNFKQLVQKLTKWEELAQELAKLKDLAPELAKLNALVQKLSAKQLAPELTEREDLARELPKLKDVGRKLTGLKQPPQELEAEQLAQDLTEWEDLAKQPGTEELTQELTEWKGLAQNSSTKELNTLKDIQFRLYVVEDLSRDVIEVLGSGLGIEPSFFRAHIVDYAWYNVRDRWRDPPTLNVDSRQQNWIQLRYVTARYFESEDGYKKAEKEAEGFNILRRPDDDLSNRSWWDKEGAKVGLTRARATFWLKPGHTPGTTAIGMYG
jgi:protein subunit release factor A